MVERHDLVVERHNPVKDMPFRRVAELGLRIKDLPVNAPLYAPQDQWEAYIKWEKSRIRDETIRGDALLSDSKGSNLENDHERTPDPAVPSTGE